MINQRQVKNHMHATLAEIKLANGRENEISTCIETETTYRYLTSGASYGQDNRYVLNTGNGGNTRWIGISGKYTYGSQLESIDNENLVFDINTAIVDGVLLNTQFNLLLYNSGTYDFYVSWGDGSFDKITFWNDSALLHTYPRVGTYTVTLVGLVLNIFPLQKVVAIKSFGKLSTQNDFYAMYNLVSLPSNPYNIMGGTLTRTPYAIFRECTALTHIDISHYVWTSSYYDGFYNFCVDCYKAEVINMKGMIVYDVIAVMSGAFANCIKVEELDFSTLDISGLIHMDWAFTNSVKLKYVKGWGGYAFSNITNFINCFSSTEELIDVDIDDTANFTSLTDISTMFNNSGINNALATKFVYGMRNSPLLIANGSFASCPNLTSLDLTSMNFGAVTDIGWIVYNCANLTSFAINGADLGNVTIMNSALGNCILLTSVGLDTWNVSSVTDMNWFAIGLTINTTEYSDALIYWATLSLQTGVTCNMGNSKYNVAGGVARAYIVTTFSWVFIDTGPE